MSNITRAFIRHLGPELATWYQAICTCGWKRDFGRMATTCEREVDWHNGKCEGTVTVHESPVDPLPRVQSIAALTAAGRKARRRARITDVSPDQRLL